MIKTISIGPGITLQCFPDSRFKQNCISVQFIRPMCREEAALNALLPAVLLRGSESCRNLRDITLRLDELYGAGVSALVRRVGDFQTTGLYCSFMDDKYAFPGDRILEPVIAFLGELLLKPITENGVFRKDYVESEKKNLISAIESDRNDKRIYVMSQMLKIMCRADSYGIPRVGEIQQVASITPEALYAHYRRILRESRIHLFYAGSSQPEQIGQLLRQVFTLPPRTVPDLPPQMPFQDRGPGGENTETLEIAQGKLAMGYTTPITNRDPEFAAMQVFNAIFGAGMTSKLFMNIREKQSLCYSIGSGYYGSKGIVTVAAGIDSRNQQKTVQEIQKQLDACCQGQISADELEAGKQAIISSLRSVHDSLGAIENYYSTMEFSGLNRTPEQYLKEVSAVSAEQAAAAARTVRLHTTYFLKGAVQ